MLSGSAILRISLLLVVAGCLAALIQSFLPHAAPESPTPAAEAPAPRRGEPAPAPAPSEPPRPIAAAPAPTPTPAPVPEPAPPPPAEAPPAPVPEPPPAADLTIPQLSGPTGQAAVDEANDTAGPRALALVDINTAPLAVLNGLRGGGNIGRAIIQRRPYATIDQLLSKRVLSRATYDRIKDQITAR